MVKCFLFLLLVCYLLFFFNVILTTFIYLFFLKDVQCTVYEEEQTDEPVNSALYYYFQLGNRSIELDCLSELYGHIIGEHAFDELRTKQQLGVSLFCIFYYFLKIGF